MRNCIRPDARSIPMVVPYAGGILSGQGMLVGAFFGVAASDAAQNASVECETRGEFELTKEPALAITQGARVGGWVAAVLAGAGAVLALLAVSRRQGRAEAEQQAARDALQARERADAASAEYRADGAADRLRSGRF